jgi:basic amino acid/polyamine antiporter, APA family
MALNIGAYLDYIKKLNYFEKRNLKKRFFYFFTLTNTTLRSLFRKKSVGQILDELHAAEQSQEGQLSKTLRLRDLVSFGIAAIIGAGIFSTIGNASFHGGPAVVFLFIFTAIACLFSALCYAEFASVVPISGSAYTYAYTTFGELIAWILGWALVMEYAIGNIVVAISWSGYFTTLMEGLGLNVPTYLTIDYRSAAIAFEEATKLLSASKAITPDLMEGYKAWTSAPVWLGIKIIFDMPALFITLVMTSLVYVGIRESKTASNLMVLLKLSVVFVVIVVGAFYIKPENWNPFAPNGISGILKGVSSVFFAYIGFDAISTTAEECKNPKRDLPLAMIYALIICTVLYILIALVLTGMVNYTLLRVDDPLAFVFQQLDLNFMAGVLAVSAVIATTGVFLVFQLGQPRILMTMSRDGLLPKSFSKIHPRFKTPYISTIATGLLVAIPMFFLRSSEVLDLSSIGTLFAFALVSAGVLFLESSPKHVENQRFRVPYINGKWIVPILFLTILVIVYRNYPSEMTNFFTFQSGELGFWETFKYRIPMWCYVITCVLLTYYTFIKNFSLIPVLGILTNFYLITELGVYNWMGFGVWMLIGLSIYFTYGFRYSKLIKR